MYISIYAHIYVQDIILLLYLFIYKWINKQRCTVLDIDKETDVDIDREQLL